VNALPRPAWLKSAGEPGVDLHRLGERPGAREPPADGLLVREVDAAPAQQVGLLLGVGAAAGVGAVRPEVHPHLPALAVAVVEVGGEDDPGLLVDGEHALAVDVVALRGLALDEERGALLPHLAGGEVAGAGAPLAGVAPRVEDTEDRLLPEVAPGVAPVRDVEAEGAVQIDHHVTEGLVADAGRDAARLPVPRGVVPDVVLLEAQMPVDEHRAAPHEREEDGEGGAEDLHRHHPRGVVGEGGERRHLGAADETEPLRLLGVAVLAGLDLHAARREVARLPLEAPRHHVVGDPRAEGVVPDDLVAHLRVVGLEVEKREAGDVVEQLARGAEARLARVLLGGEAVGLPPLDPARLDHLDAHAAPDGVDHAGEQQVLGLRDVVRGDGGPGVDGGGGRGGEEERACSEHERRRSHGGHPCQRTRGGTTAPWNATKRRGCRGECRLRRNARGRRGTARAMLTARWTAPGAGPPTRT
jgi:hypothetical protein